MNKYSTEQLHEMVIGLQDFVPDQVDRLNPYEVLSWAEEDAETEYHGEQADYYRIENGIIVGLSKEQLNEIEAYLGELYAINEEDEQWSGGDY